MLKLFKILRDAGNSTVKYPFAPLEVPAGFRGKPQYDPEQCIACAACTVACPANALTMETDVVNGTRTWQLFLGRCIFCGRCEEVCPTRAIVLSQEFEMAVTNKADLFQRATFRLLACHECHRPFAPEKEVAYTVALLQQAGMSAEDAQARRRQFETCPECKRKQSMPHKGNITLSQHFITPPAAAFSQGGHHE